MAVKVWNEEVVTRLQKEGRGQGAGETYEPWLQFGDFSSKGVARRIYGVKVPRVHHYFSDGEYRFLVLAEWSENVFDIREQFPMQRKRTQSIARDLGVHHDCYDGTHTPVVMTTDFLLSVIDGDGVKEVAVDIKPDSAAADERAVEKLEIHRTYFEQEGIDHHLVFESSISETVFDNIDTIRGKLPRKSEPPQNLQELARLAPLMTEWTGSLHGAQLDMRTSSVCREFDGLHGLEAGMGLRVLANLFFERALPVNLRVPQLFQATWRDLTSKPQPDFAGLLERQWAA
ncbi:TnsA endonuclease N-terminal domain-containing protein [Nostoc sp. NIES-2111]